MDVGLVCDACDGFSGMGAQTCSKCGARLGPLTPAREAPAPEPASAGAPCHSCGEMVAPGHGFCGRCGTPAGAPPTVEPAPAPAPSKPRKASTMFFGAMQQAHAKLVLIKGDGLDGVSFTLAGSEHIAGRTDAALLFEEDFFLSPTHANFIYADGKLRVRDEDSVNGVYIRIHGSTAIQPGDRFLVGEQVLDVEPGLDGTSDPVATEDGTYYFASPRKTNPFRIVQVLRGGDTGLAYCASNEVVSLGREGNDVDFPDDPFISGNHAQVAIRDGTLVLTDLDSKNGTFLKVNREQELRHGDYVFMGQQLLRVEIV